MDENWVDIVPFEDADHWGGVANLIEFHPDSEDRLIGNVPLDRLTEFNPFLKSPWHDGKGVTLNGVKSALETFQFESEPYSAEFAIHKRSWGRAKHEARIAHLIHHGFDEPICIEFNDAEGSSISLFDGHHRLAAAIYMDNKEISVELGGFLSGSVTALGIFIPKYQVLSAPENSNCDI